MESSASSSVFIIKKNNGISSIHVVLERPCMCIGQLWQGATVLCVIDVVGLCSNIPHSQGLATLQKFLELRDNKQISSDTLIELAEIMLKKHFWTRWKNLLTDTWSLNWNKVCPFICYFVYRWLRGKHSQRFWGETYDTVQIHWRHSFYLGTWRKISGKIYKYMK